MHKKEKRISFTLPIEKILRFCYHANKKPLFLLEKEFPHRPTMLLAGGSMMYIDAVCKGIDDIPTVDEETRAMVLEKYEKEGLEQL